MYNKNVYTMYDKENRITLTVLASSKLLYLTLMLSLLGIDPTTLTKCSELTYNINNVHKIVHKTLTKYSESFFLGRKAII